MNTASENTANPTLTTYRQDGFIVVENLIPAELLNEVVEYIEKQHAPESDVIRRYNSAGKLDFTKIKNLAEKNDIFRKVATYPALVEKVEELIGQKALIFRDVLVVKPAREGAYLDYHQDSEYWDVEPRQLVSAWIPFSDVEIENGCLTVIKGSHRGRAKHDLYLTRTFRLPYFITQSLRKVVSLAGTGDSDASGFSFFRKLKNGLLGSSTKKVSFLANLQDLKARVSPALKKNEVSLPIKAGSVILFHSLLLHASHPNQADNDRRAYIVSYMGENYQFVGVGQPELLVAGASAEQPVLAKVRK